MSLQHTPRHRKKSGPSKILEILVLNDQSIVAHAVSRSLLNSGHLAETICRTDQAIEILESGRKIDHIIVDLRLAIGESAIDFISKEIQPRGIKFTIVSAYPEWDGANMWAPIGFEPGILRSTDYDEILRDIESRHNVKR